MLSEGIARVFLTIYVPLVLLVPVVSIIEGFLVWVNHRLGFKGVYLLNSSDVPSRLMIPAGAQPFRGEVGAIRYLIPGGREILFAGSPSLFRSTYMLKGRALDLGGVTRLEVRAPLSLCLGFAAVSAIFLGMTGVGFATGGFAAGGVFLLLGAGLVAVLRWRVKRAVAAAEAHLEDILTDLSERRQEGP